MCTDYGTELELAPGSSFTPIDASKSQYVKLNVGGALFQTTLSTIMKHDTMLRAMFSGRMEVFTDESGWVLIDRCGKHFGTILNFLRDGSIPRPNCGIEIMEIMNEAKFYLIQDLIQLCQTWLWSMQTKEIEPVGISKVPIIFSKKEFDIIVNRTKKPLIKLLINRHNNKYSYTAQSDDNLMKNLELFDRILFRFTSRVLFVRDVGAGSSEVCQWSFFGQRMKKAEICCTSIVYATDRKQTKVEFPEARIYEEAMNVLLFEEQQICSRCGKLEKNCTLASNFQTAHLQLPLLSYSSHSNSVSPHRKSPSPLMVGNMNNDEERQCVSNNFKNRSYSSGNVDELDGL